MKVGTIVVINHLLNVGMVAKFTRYDEEEGGGIVISHKNITNNTTTTTR